MDSAQWNGKYFSTLRNVHNRQIEACEDRGLKVGFGHNFSNF